MLSGAAARDPKAFSSREIEGMSEASAPKRVTRRTIAKGAAWTVPAVVVAAPAASAASSPPEPIVPTFQEGSFCKHSSGGSGCDYHTVICFKNTTSENITLTLGNMVRDGDSETRPGTFSVGGAEVTTYEVPAGQECCLYVDGGRFSDCTNVKVRQYFSYAYGMETINTSVYGPENISQGSTPCGTNPVEDEPGGNPPHATSGPSPVCQAV